MYSFGCITKGCLNILGLTKVKVYPKSPPICKGCKKPMKLFSLDIGDPFPSD